MEQTKLTPEMLSFIETEGIIDLNDVQYKMKEKEKQRLLKKHKFEIWQGKNGRWYTFLPDELAKNGRRQVAKSSQERLEKSIVEFYAAQEDDKYESKYLETLRSLYPKWITYKKNHTSSSAYIKRLNVDWEKYYIDDPLVDMLITELTFIKVDNWCHSIVQKYHLNKKQYYNMSTILRQMLEFATLDGINIIESNPMDKVKIQTKLFVKKALPVRESQVFFQEEQKLIAKECVARYDKRSNCTTPLGILLNFNLGLRIGELVTIKWTDISDDYIRIQRMEISEYDINEDEKVEITNLGFGISDYTKSAAGERKIYLNSIAKDILQKIRKTNIQNDYYDDDYIFISSQSRKRSTSSTFAKYLWNVCASLGINTKKGNHKIRKTFLSSLMDCNVNIDTVREIAGHEDERTLLHNYCFDAKDDSELKKQLEDSKNKITSFYTAI